MDSENRGTKLGDSFAESAAVSVGSAKCEVTIQKSQREIPDYLRA